MNPSLYIAIGLIALWAVFSVYYILKGFSDYKSVNGYIFDSIPSVFTTLGILGTFIGIAIGLYEFNVNDIDNSIPKLLEGMKTAFLSSIIGIILSLVSSKFVSVAQKKGENEGIYDSKEVEQCIHPTKYMFSGS